MVNKNDFFPEFNNTKINLQSESGAEDEIASLEDGGTPPDNGEPPVEEEPVKLFFAKENSIECHLDINMNSLRVTEVGDPDSSAQNGVDGAQTYSDDAVRLEDTKDLLLRPEYASNIQCLMLKGGTMQGSIDMGSHEITGIDDYYYSGDVTAIASGAALISAIKDYVGAWLTAKEELKALEDGGLDELIKDLGTPGENESITNPTECKLLLKDGKNGMTGDLTFVDQDLVGGVIEGPEEGDSGEGGDGGSEGGGGDGGGTGGTGGGDAGNGSDSGGEGTEEVPTEPERNPTVINLKEPEELQDIVTRKTVDEAMGKLPLTGGNVLGDIDANGYSITNLKEHEAVITADSSASLVNAFSVYVEKLDLGKEVTDEDISKVTSETPNESELVTVSDVKKSFENKYTLEYLCYGLNTKTSINSLDINWSEGSESAKSQNSENFWEVSSDTLKIKKSGVYLFALNVSSPSESISTYVNSASACTLKLSGIQNSSGSSSGSGEEILAKFSLDSKGSASVTSLIYIEPSYLGESVSKNTGEANLSLQVEGITTSVSTSWQISYIEDVSENKEESSSANQNLAAA
ncbi:hypothetical protein [Chlamydiifrater phoenicopteri]|uniref:hypothetical protein n=1 Tax=Chlamydiifrater phoenicopteri TaxID=2681469 RepID=UPI001BCEF8F1|nr:hypothetical protein [Chlamydiifrater phoenicopteri]